jgi:putative NIF3 family GTP cyclohydrolase 1 type 2
MRPLTSQLAMQRQKKPTHAAVTRFIASLLPLKENDVPRLYHVPRNPRYDPETAVVDQIVLSVTPTPGVYSYIGYTPEDTNNNPSVPHSTFRPRPPRTLCFLHRPFTLDRRSVRRGTLVVSSHTSFDEVLTVGWNTVLAERLQMNVDDSVCVQGYKGDPERRIGIVGQVAMLRDLLLRRIKEEFGEAELAHDGLSDEIRAVAIMNAFGEEEVHRVLESALQHGWAAADDEAPGKHLLYLTGQPRVAGLEAAKALGMTVACVGHLPAEEWGIRHMAARLRVAFPGVRVEEVYEVETPRPKDLQNSRDSLIALTHTT